MKENGNPLLGDSKLRLEDLFKKFFPEEPYRGHNNGFLDVKNLKRLFTETKLKNELLSLEKWNYTQWINNEAVPQTPLPIATRQNFSMSGAAPLDPNYVPLH